MLWSRELRREMGDVGGGVCTGESVGGGTDVWSSSGPAAADHLVVMVHGILGRWRSSLNSAWIVLVLSFVLGIGFLSCGFYLDLEWN